MVEINWRSDYHREFACPSCGEIGMRLRGSYLGKQRFFCPQCQKTSVESQHLSSIRAKIKSYWSTDYNFEFACPECGEIGMRFAGNTASGKKIFLCPQCRRKTYESVPIKLRHSNYKDYWDTDYKVGEFACPNPTCEARNVYQHGYSGKKGRKRMFCCQTCGATALESVDLNFSNIRHYGQQGLGILPVLPFDYQSNKWDLRAILPSIDARDIQTVNFDSICCDWFRELAKHYIYHLCKLNTPANTIVKRVSHLRMFSRYLASRDIRSMEDVKRNLVINFLVAERQLGVSATAINGRCATLRDFFWTGNSQGWFQVEQDIIRNEDISKSRRGNPDPIPDSVREQIENNLHKLPSPIARMWIIAFFTAMRPSELAFLKKDCLLQEGSHWKIVWWRKKGKNQHEVPVSRTIAQVVQEQQEYIEQLWGQDWQYLFCHYQGLKPSKDQSKLELKPVREVMLTGTNPLTWGIRHLIETEDIRDENGELARFSNKLIRPTRLTKLFEQGHDLAVVSAWAGHKNPEITATYYTYVSCEQIEKEAGYIQKALFNADGQQLNYESLPKSFWKNPRAHQLELSGDHINTPIYGYCGLPLDQRCDKFRACYTCRCFVAVPEKLTQYIKTRDELRGKESRAKTNGQEVLVEQFGRQADQLDKIIASLEGAA